MKHAQSKYDQVQDPSGHIPEDEPVFLLRAQDPTAALVVRFWAKLAESIGASPEKIELALKQAREMDKWPVKKDAPGMGEAHE